MIENCHRNETQTADFPNKLVNRSEECGSGFCLPIVNSKTAVCEHVAHEMVVVVLRAATASSQSKF